LPDLVVSSPATRALHTATIYCQNLNYNPDKIQKESDLYEGLTTQELVGFLQKLPEEINTVYVFGHNPTVYYLVYNLVKYFNSDMPTCSTVALDFDVEQWKDVTARGAKIAFQLVPKML
jgi:phosphohistidine phosphatase